MNRYIPAERLLSPLRGTETGGWKHRSTQADRIRKSGLTAFEMTGIPTSKVEAWKYTDLSPLTELDFSLDTGDPGRADDPGVKEYLPERLSECSLVFVNGTFSRKLSVMPQVPGLFIDNVKNIIESGTDDVLECIGMPENGPDPMTSLNRAYFNDGIVIRVGRGIDPGFPVHLIFLSVPADGAVMTHPGNLIIAEEDSRFSLIEEYTGDPEAAYFTNSVTEIHLKDGASVSHYKIQTESPSAYHIGSLHVRQGSGTRFSSRTATFGGLLTRNNISASMDGPGSDSTLEGLYFLKGSQHTDNHTEVLHHFPSCTSSENFNGVLDGESRAVFDGKVYVGRGSVQTDSSQSSRSLLLSGSASVDSKPTLEIYADDVKCSHSASVGQIDTDSLYYLRSRGISEKEAMKILTSGFLKEILDRFENKDVSAKIEKILSREITL